ncbi:hypothetical protein Ddc_02472 [Ditylenchus destructor]|nr:hypothetical protein Ddc_02472 [Ditylenchus destructor]
MGIPKAVLFIKATGVEALGLGLGFPAMDGNGQGRRERERETDRGRPVRLKWVGSAVKKTPPSTKFWKNPNWNQTGGACYLFVVYGRTNSVLVGKSGPDFSALGPCAKCPWSTRKPAEYGRTRPGPNLPARGWSSSGSFAHGGLGPEPGPGRTSYTNGFLY